MMDTMSTKSRYLQGGAVLVERAPDWAAGSVSFIDSSRIVFAQRTASVAAPTTVSPYSAETTSPVSQTPRTNEQEARAALKARYKAMANTAWFRAAHEDRSIGEAVKLT